MSSPSWGYSFSLLGHMILLLNILLPHLLIGLIDVGIWVSLLLGLLFFLR